MQKSLFLFAIALSLIGCKKGLQAQDDSSRKAALLAAFLKENATQTSYVTQFSQGIGEIEVWGYKVEGIFFNNQKASNIWTNAGPNNIELNWFRNAFDVTFIATTEMVKEKEFTIIYRCYIRSNTEQAKIKVVIQKTYKDGTKKVFEEIMDVVTGDTDILNTYPLNKITEIKIIL